VPPLPEPTNGTHETCSHRAGQLLNVLFFTSWYPSPEFTYGGVFVREHAKAVREAGHRVVVLHLAGPSPKHDGGLWAMEELEASLTDGVEAYRVSHRHLRARGASYPLYLRAAMRAYRRLGEGGFRPDVIHAHVYGAGVPAAVVAARNGIPFVVTEHFSGVAQRSLNRVEVRKARYAYTRAARVLPVSRFLEAAIRSYGIDVPFEVVPNAVDTALFFPSHTVQQNDGTSRLIFVGNLEPSCEKSFPTLLEALARLAERRRDWHLDVLGGGAERESYEATAAALGLAGQLTFHGSQPKPEVARMMRAAHLLVLPSRVETFGAAAAEALVSGLPVLATAVGGIPELVDERSGRLVPPEDPVALAEGLDETLDKLETFDRSAIATRARDRYSLPVVGDRLARIYDSVLAESRVDAARSPTQRPQTPVRHEQNS
jgi:glycosyltransferase involved in cell wall biosynthesis